MVEEWYRGEYRISTDRAQLDLEVIHNFLSASSYWARGRSMELVKRSIEHSLPFGLYKNSAQVGFARVVTDRATFAWLADVFVSNEYRGQGLGKWLVETVLAHADLQGLRRWVLATKDAHELYRRFGFTEMIEPERWMIKSDPQMRAQTQGVINATD